MLFKIYKVCKINYKPDLLNSRVARFLLGLVLLSTIIIFFASGLFPPGISGEVLRHNKANDIDASPLLYSEVENMAELEESVRILREKAITSCQPDN